MDPEIEEMLDQCDNLVRKLRLNLDLLWDHIDTGKPDEAAHMLLATHGHLGSLDELLDAMRGDLDGIENGRRTGES